MRTHARALVLLSLLSFTAFAQTAPGTATLTGVITDSSSGQPLADVVVTATSASRQGEVLAVTDAEGVYTLAALPPGVYSLKLERETYKVRVQNDIELKIDRTYRVNVGMVPEAVQGEDVVVVATKPMVDVGSSATGLELGPEHVKNLPLLAPNQRTGAVRSFEGLADMVPQAGADRFGYSLNGSQGPENQFVVDGLSVNDVAFGVLATPLSMEFVKAANVITGGYMPEYGRSLGGIFNVVTKSGSNEFHGSVFGRLTPGVLSPPRPFITSDGSSIAARTAPYNAADYGFEVGGPIILNKLWFYVGFDPSVSRLQTTRKLVWYQETTDAAGDFLDYERGPDGKKVARDLPGTTQTYFSDTRTYNYIGKLTFSPWDNHQFTLTLSGAPSASGFNGNPGVSPLDGSYDRFRSSADPYESARTGPIGSNMLRYISDVHDVSLRYSGALFDRKVLLDVTGGWHHQRFAQLPVDSAGAVSQLGSTPQIQIMGVPGGLSAVEALSAQNLAQCTSGVPGAERCPLDKYFIGGAGYVFDSVTDRAQLKATATAFAKFLGHHIFKLGFDGEVSRYQSSKGYTGGTILQTAGPDAVADYRRFGFFSGPGSFVELPVRNNDVTSTVYGAFLQDSWSVVDLLTLNLGLRFDQQTMFGADQLGLVLPSQFSPRLGLVYDFTKKGRSKVFFNYGKFYEVSPLNIGDRNFPPEPGYYGIRDNSARQCDFIGQNLTPAQVNGIYQAPGCNQPRVFEYGFSTARTAVDPNLQAQSSDELVAGAEFQPLDDMRVSLTGTYRWLSNVIEDMSRDEGNTYFIGNPGYGIASDFDKASRIYMAATLAVSKGSFDNWYLQGSYTLSSLFGNYPGLYQPETGQLDPNTNTNFDLVSLVPNRFGPLPGDRNHALKLYASKTFKFSNSVSMVIGGSWRSVSGAPINYLASHPVYGANEVFALPRGSAGRLPWVHSLDGRLALSVKLPKALTLDVGIDVFNLFNFQQVTEVDQTLTFAAVTPSTNATSSVVCQRKMATGCVDVQGADGMSLPTNALNANFGRPTAFQAPRQFRLEARVSF